jgi:hypothetical protein
MLYLRHWRIPNRKRNKIFILFHKPPHHPSHCHASCARYQQATNTLVISVKMFHRFVNLFLPFSRSLFLLPIAWMFVKIHKETRQAKEKRNEVEERTKFFLLNSNFPHLLILLNLMKRNEMLGRKKKKIIFHSLCLPTTILLFYS